MPQPLLDLGDNGLMVKYIRGRLGPQGMRPKAFDITGADYAGIVSHHPVDPIGSGRRIETMKAALP